MTTRLEHWVHPDLQLHLYPMMCRGAATAASRTGQEQHPFHLHGHHFWVLATGNGTWDPASSPASYNLVNPVYRDTYSLLANGWAVIRFEVRCWSCLRWRYGECRGAKSCEVRCWHLAAGNHEMYARAGIPRVMFWLVGLLITLSNHSWQVRRLLLPARDSPVRRQIEVVGIASVSFIRWASLPGHGTCCKKCQTCTGQEK